MKQFAKKSLVTALILFLLAGCAATTGNQAEFFSQPALQQSDDTMRTVHVSGLGEIQIEPDTAVINLGVQTQGKTAQIALRENNTTMQSLIDTLEKTNIPSENIQTQTIRLSPQYEINDTNNSRTVTGYTASNIVEVRTEDLESLGTLLDDAINAGANTIENIRFEASGSEKLLDQVRETAVKNARHKAEELAKLTGSTLGPVLEIQESSSTPGPIVRQLNPQTEAAAVPVSPGSQSISVQVQVTWVLIVNNEK